MNMKSLLALLFAAAAPFTYASAATQYHKSNSGLCFTENRGQWYDRVLYKAEGAGGLTWFIERDGFTLLYSIPNLNAKPLENPRGIGMPEEMRKNEPKIYPRKGHALKFKFVTTSFPVAPASLPVYSLFTPGPEAGATAREIIPSDRLSHNNNYFLGNDRSKWAPDCGNFEGVTLRGVWEGIDVNWHEKNGHVEFDFVVNPGADPNQIQMRVDGLKDALEMTADGGEIVLPTSLGDVKMAMPEAWIDDDDNDEVAAKFVPVGDNRLGIALPEGYKAGKKLIVDPLVYSTYLGGGTDEVIHAIASDGEGRVVVAGSTNSNDFPITDGALDESHNGGDDGFVARLSEDGSELLYSTYLGGSQHDVASSLASDGAGGVLLTGYTQSNNFPTTDGALDESHNGGWDALVARLNGDGDSLLYCTYLGGGDYDLAFTLAPDGAGGVVVAGYTESNDFPTTDGALDESFNGSTVDAFVARLNGDGSELIYSTYLGGGNDDGAYGIVPDGAGGVVAAGWTYSDDFPNTEGAFDRSFNGNVDAFVARLSGDGSELLYGTYLGGGSGDYAVALAPDGAGGVVVVGSTGSNDFPTTEGAFDRSFSDYNLSAFIARLSGDGSKLIYGTYLGGNWSDGATAAVPDGEGGVVIAGLADSDDFPTTEGAYDRSFNFGPDAFVARLNEDGSDLLYSTYLGGSGEDHASAIAPDGNGGVFVAGYTLSDDFPVTEGAFQENYAGGDLSGGDAFITDIDIGLLPPGTLFGHVYDLTDGTPLSDALVFTNHRDTVLTDEEGYYHFDCVNAGNFSLTATKAGYNDSTLTDLHVDPEDTVEIDFSLRHPTISVDEERFSANLSDGESQEFGFHIADNGNGLLRWTSRIKIDGLEDLTPLTRRGFIPAADSTNDNQLHGVAFANDRFYIAGANGNDPNMIYVLNRDGHLLNSFQQVGQARNGMHDLDWDGEKLWGSGEQTVFAFSTNGDLVTSWQGPENANQAITCDDEGHIWVAGVSGNYIYSYDQAGNQIGRTGYYNWKIYGLAWWADDPDGHPLYVLHCPDNGSQLLSKVDPVHDDTMFVARFDVPGTPQGAAITSDHDIYTVNLVTLSDAGAADGGDRIDLWLLDVNTSWARLDPDSGEVIPGEQAELNLTLDASGLRENNKYQANLVLCHNAVGGDIDLPVELIVRGAPKPPGAFGLAYPADGDTTAVPQVAFGWERSIDPNPEDVVNYILWISSYSDSVFTAVPDTAITLGLDTLGLRFGDDSGALWWVDAISAGDTTSGEKRFRLFTRGLNAGALPTTPLEFSLEKPRPNPFNSVVQIPFAVPYAAKVSVTLYDLSGRRVAVLVNDAQSAGLHTVNWLADNAPTGIYFVRMTAPGFETGERMILIK